MESKNRAKEMKALIINLLNKISRLYSVKKHYTLVRIFYSRYARPCVSNSDCVPQSPTCKKGCHHVTALHFLFHPRDADGYIFRILPICEDAGGYIFHIRPICEDADGYIFHILPICGDADGYVAFFHICEDAGGYF